MIDDAALQGLNMLWFVSVMTPGGQSMTQGIGQLEDLLGRFPSDNLPQGRRWLDHLDMIDLVRITAGGIATLKKFVPLFADKWPGFFSTGIDEATAAGIMKQSLQRGINCLQIVEHELKPGHYRLKYYGLGQLRVVMKANAVPDEDIEFVVNLARDQGNVEMRDDSLIPQLEAAIEASPLLSRIRSWWDQIPDYPQATSAGVAIAYANSRRYYEFENINGLAEYLEQST
jgi:hypothetical protein